MVTAVGGKTTGRVDTKTMLAAWPGGRRITPPALGTITTDTKNNIEKNGIALSFPREKYQNIQLQ